MTSYKKVDQKITKLKEELAIWEARLEHFPKIGETVMDLRTNKEFVLTERVFDLIEFYNDWAYIKRVPIKEGSN